MDTKNHPASRRDDSGQVEMLWRGAFAFLIQATQCALTHPVGPTSRAANR